MLAAIFNEAVAALSNAKVLLCQVYTVCEAAAKEPSPDLGWEWPVLGIRDSEELAQPGEGSAERARRARKRKETLGPPKKGDQHAGQAQVRGFCLTLVAIHDFDVDMPCAARRRRERRLRAFFRHEKLTVAMTMATVLHHSRDKGTRFDQKALLDENLGLLRCRHGWE